MSNLGRIKSLYVWVGNQYIKKYQKRDKILKPIKDKKEYLYVHLTKRGNEKCFKIHRLVAEAFIDNPNKLPQVNHINGIKTDNRVENLEWCTNKENQNHAWKLGLQKPRYSKNNPKARSVNQYDLQGNFIKTWDSLMDIERELNISHTYISLCCRHKVKEAKGYIWEYKDT